MKKTAKKLPAPTETEGAVSFVRADVDLTVTESRDGQVIRTQGRRGDYAVKVSVDGPGSARATRHDLRVALHDLAETLGGVFGDPIESADVYVVVRRERRP